jgi:hypothetical protein
MPDWDADRHPALAGYLAGLPAGIDSHPQCFAKSSLLRAVIDETGGPRRLEGIPSVLARHIDEPEPPNAWIPEVIYVAAHFALKDVLGIDDDEMLGVTFRANKKLTESRMYRALAMVASPELLLKGAQVGWRVLHRGVSLRVHVVDRSAEISVRHPIGLWTELAHRSAALGFSAVITAARGRDPVVEVTESREDGARFALGWR